jgi:hypothetical protein
VRSAGLYGLAGLDDDDAVAAVLTTLKLNKSSEKPDPPWGLDAWDRLRNRQWSQEVVRWRYLREFVVSLERCLDELGEQARARIQFPACERIIDRIDTLEAIARVSNGRSGQGLPSLSVDGKVARETARRWREWLTANDPQTKR